MTFQIDLTQEELDELEAMIRQDLDGSREELHHTSRAQYKHDVKRHIELAEHVLATIGKARTARSAAAGTTDGA